MPHVFGPYNAPTFRVGDGTWVSVPGDPVASFPAWTRAMGRQDLLTDERFATRETRAANRAAMVAEIARWGAGVPSFTDAERMLGDERLVAGAVRSISEAAGSDWAVARGAIAQVDDRGGGTIGVPRSPLRFDGREVGPAGPAAHRGEHNREVLSEVLGLQEDELDRLEREGVISSRMPG